MVLGQHPEVPVLTIFHRKREMGESYAGVARETGAEILNEYVELDTTYFNDCRHLPSTPKVTAAIQRGNDGV